MKVSTHTKSRLVGWTDQITGLGLKIGGAMVALSLIYLLVTFKYAFSDQGQLLTTLAIVWLTIIVISYALRALEYLVFELQV